MGGTRNTVSIAALTWAVIGTAACRDEPADRPTAAPRAAAIVTVDPSARPTHLATQAGVSVTRIPGPPGGVLRAASFPRAGLGYAVVDDAAGHTWVGKTVDGGQSWRALGQSTAGHLHAVHFIDDQNGIAVGTLRTSQLDALVLRTTDGGATWTESHPPTKGLYDVVMRSAGEAFAVGALGVFRTADGGATWRRVHDGAVHHVAFAGPFGYALSGTELVRSDDGGATWASLARFGEEQRSDLAVTGPDRVFAAGTRGLRVWSGGEPARGAERAHLAALAVGFVDEQRGFMITGGAHRGPAGLLVTRDGGATWELGYTGRELAHATDIFTVPGDGAYVVASGALTALRFVGPGGASSPLDALDLTPIEGAAIAGGTPPPAHHEGCEALAGAAPRCGVLEGAGVTFSCDGGVTVAAGPRPAPNTSFEVTPLAAPGVLYARTRMTLMRLDDGGCTWREHGREGGALSELHPGPGDVAYGMLERQAHVVRVDGEGARRVTPPGSDRLAGLGVSAERADVVAAVGVEGVVWSSRDAGQTWQRAGAVDVPPDTSDPLGSVHHAAFNPTDLDHLVVATAHAEGVEVTRDAGQTWTRAAGSVARTRVVGLVFGPDGETLWALTAAADRGPWSISRSRDGGATFASACEGVSLRFGAPVPDPVAPHVLHFLQGTDHVRCDANTGRLDRRPLPAIPVAKNARSSAAPTPISLAFALGDPRLIFYGLRGAHGAVH